MKRVSSSRPHSGRVALVTGATRRRGIGAAICRELAERGATINTVNPGPTDSGWISEELYKVLLPRFPSGRLGTPQDAARLVYFLVSPEGGWITGQVIHSEGGFRRS